MSISFAGARCVDERRRRRLAQEADCETAPERRGPVRAHTAVSSAAPDEPKLSTSPAESLVRRQLWVHVVTAMLMLGLGAGALLAGDWVDQMRPDLAAAFGLESGLFVRVLRAGCLLAAAQLAYINLWYRVRSRKDFSGRYRVWYFVVPAWLLFSFAAATDAHQLAAHAANERWPLAIRNAELLWWMVPAGVIVLALTRLLNHEMRRTTGCVLFLWGAMITALVHAVLLLSQPVLAETHGLFLFERGVAVLWPVCLLLAMLFYARYVIHVSSEPSEQPASKPAEEPAAEQIGFFAHWKQARGDARAKRAKAKAAAQARAKAEAAASKEPAELKDSRAAEKQPQESRKTRRTAAAETGKDQAPASSNAARIARRDGPAAPSAAARGPRQPVREPEEDDIESGEDSLQHLSKKERRRLRKIRRQRSAAAS